MTLMHLPRPSFSGFYVILRRRPIDCRTLSLPRRHFGHSGRGRRGPSSIKDTSSVHTSLLLYMISHLPPDQRPRHLNGQQLDQNTNKQTNKKQCFEFDPCSVIKSNCSKSGMREMEF